jgi:hypothetical protein
LNLEAEVGKRAVEGWDAILRAHLGPAGATLVWTLLWVVAAVLALVFARYVGVLGAGGATEGSPERLAYDRLREGLEDGGSPTRIYKRLLTRFLDWVDRFFGDYDKAESGIFRGAFGLRGSFPLWTGAALRRCLHLALVYPILSVILIWAISGHVGVAETTLGLPADISGWGRGLYATLLAGLVIGVWKCGTSTVPLHRRLWFFVAAVAAAGSGSVASIVASVGAGAAAVSFTILVAGGGAFAIAAIVLALVIDLGARAVPANVVETVGVILFIPVVVLAFWLSGVGSLYSRLDRLPAWDLLGPLVLFFGLLSVLNAPFDWLSVGLTRALLRRGVELRGWWPFGLAGLDGALGLMILVLLAGAMVIGVQAFDLAATLGGAQPTLPLGPLFDGIANYPGDPVNWWVYALLLSTLIPSLINLLIGSVSLTRGVPGVSTLLLRFMPVGVAVPAFDRTWIATVLTCQWLIGLIFMLAAFALLGWLVSTLVPEVGTLFLDYARAVAALDLPRRAWGLIGH